MAKNWSCSFVVWLVFVCARQCWCLCPEGFSGFTEVIMCLQNITHGPDDMNVLAGTTTNTIRHYCLDGRFNETVTCLSGLYKQCEHERGQELLRQIARPQLWQHGIQTLCANLHVHARYSDCIVEQRPGIYSCLQYNDKMFMRVAGQQRNWHTITFNICRYYTGMRRCTGSQVKDKCDVGVGTLLENYIATITPLLCDGNAAKSSSSLQQQRLWYPILLPAVLVTVMTLKNYITTT